MKEKNNGIVVSTEIWQDRALSMRDKLIFANVCFFDKGEGCCKTNKEIAVSCDCSERTVSRSISKLTKLKYLTVVSFNGRNRCIRVISSR